MAMVQRNGNVRVRKIERVDAATLGSAIAECVEPGSTVYTDDNKGYKRIAKSGYRHDLVNHSRREYARGEVSTNTVEGFFSILKRGVYGTFHSISKHHMHRYLAEFEFRYNHRDVDDGERTLSAIRGAEGKRLLYAADTA